MAKRTDTPSLDHGYRGAALENLDSEEKQEYEGFQYTTGTQEKGRALTELARRSASSFVRSAARVTPTGKSGPSQKVCSIPSGSLSSANSSDASSTSSPTARRAALTIETSETKRDWLPPRPTTNRPSSSSSDCLNTRTTSERARPVL